MTESIPVCILYMGKCSLLMEFRYSIFGRHYFKCLSLSCGSFHEAHCICYKMVGSSRTLQHAEIMQNCVSVFDIYVVIINLFTCEFCLPNVIPDAYLVRD